MTLLEALKKIRAEGPVVRHMGICYNASELVGDAIWGRVVYETIARLSRR